MFHQNILTIHMKSLYIIQILYIPRKIRCIQLSVQPLGMDKKDARISVSPLLDSFIHYLLFCPNYMSRFC